MLINHLASLVMALALAAGGYDPLAVDRTVEVHWFDLSVDDHARQRVIPVRVYLPASLTPVPVVLFSHGLGGSREGSPFLGQHWAARGYVCVFLQHPGSDRSSWASAPPEQQEPVRLAGGNAQNFRLRVADVGAVLDALQHWNTAPGTLLHGRMDLARIGMSGHSFGALTAQAVAGERFGGGPRNRRDPRIKAAILMSPSSPRHGGDPVAAFGQVDIPWMMMMGSQDVVPFGDPGAGSRLAVFAALPPAAKYELVLDGATHPVFTEQPLAGDTHTRNPRYHRAILAISTAFWDAYLRGESAARAWLDGDGPRALLESGDRLQRK